MKPRVPLWGTVPGILANEWRPSNKFSFAVESRMMMETKRSGPLDRVPDWVILLAFCVLFSFEVLWTVRQKSATFDEPLNLTSGYLSLKCGNDRLIPQNLPLMKLLGACPLLFVDNITLPAAPRREGWK